MKLKLPLRVVGYTPVKIFDDRANVLAEFEYRDIKIAKEFVKRCNEHEQLKETAEKYKSAHEVLAGECSKLMEEVGAENRQLKQDRAELISIIEDLKRYVNIPYHIKEQIKKIGEL